MTTQAFHAIRTVLFAVLAALVACGGTADPPDGAGAREYRMGFSPFGPRVTIEDILATVDMWTPRADAGIVHMDVPWVALLDGAAAADVATSEWLPMVELFRDRGLMVAITIDATNGLSRDQEAAALVGRGRSVTEPEIQALYRAWAVAVAEVLRPDYLGLIAETNLVRLAAPAALYDALPVMAAAAAAEVRALADPPELYVSVQVETAWGRLSGINAYEGIAEDLVDFPFVDVLGLSSYPYLGGFETPGQIPDDYYARIADEAALPVLVVEGGWSSVSGSGFAGSPGEQADYLRRQAELLDQANALAVFQLTFTDLDLDAWPEEFPENLVAFARLGLVTDAYQPKPALAVWDSLHALPLEP